MQATDVMEIAEKGASATGPEAHETASRLTALIRYVFLYDRGNHLRVMEDSGLSITQCKVLLELGGLGRSEEAWQVGDLAELFGTSVPSMSRAVDGLVRKRLASRVEDPDDRRARQVKITGKGKDLVETLVAVRLSGVEAFAATLSAAQRRKLDAAIEALMDREDIEQTYRHLKGIESA
jgi:DNA-binding MarR family transcriptional regulator